LKDAALDPERRFELPLSCDRHQETGQISIYTSTSASIVGSRDILTTVGFWVGSISYHGLSLRRFDQVACRKSRGFLVLHEQSEFLVRDAVRTEVVDLFSHREEFTCLTPSTYPTDSR
jgi:hypothetical protein